MDQEKSNIFSSIVNYGDFIRLRFNIDSGFTNHFLKEHQKDFQTYNPSKQGYNRYGLSLTSHNGDVDGTDLNSLKEYNLLNNTKFDEMSFRTTTKYFKELSTSSSDFDSLSQLLGRSHIIKLTHGGFFPPHRDSGDSIRLILFLNSNFHETFLMLEGQRLNWLANNLYFFNTRKEHSIFNFATSSDFIVFNIEISERSRKWILERLKAH